MTYSGTLFSQRNRLTLAALLLLFSSALVANWTINGTSPPAVGGVPVLSGIPIISRFFTNRLAEPETLADTGPFRAVARLFAVPIKTMPVPVPPLPPPAQPVGGSTPGNGSNNP